MPAAAAAAAASEAGRMLLTNDAGAIIMEPHDARAGDLDRGASPKGCTELLRAEAALQV